MLYVAHKIPFTAFSLYTSGHGAIMDHESHSYIAIYQLIAFVTPDGCWLKMGHCQWGLIFANPSLL